MKNLFTDQAFMSDPFGEVEKLREQGALVKVKLPIIGKAWVTTTQSATGAILKDTNNFTLRKRDGEVTGVQWWMPKSIKLLANNMLTMDEPDHTRLRTLVDKAFRRDVMLALEPRIKKMADDLAISLFDHQSEVDLITEFARHLPLMVICEMLGLPKTDREKFTDWAGRFTKVEGIFSFLAAMRPINKIRNYLAKEIERQQHTPEKGLISELLAMQEQGAEISDDEMVAMIFLLLLAGHETTSHVISGGVYFLLQDRKLCQEILKDKNSLQLGVEELLRFVSAVQFTKQRNVRNDITVEGIELKQGDVVMPMIVAANCDPEAVECPHEFNLKRKPNHHLAFGAGPHFCLGHQLARIEIACAVRALFQAHPNLRLAKPIEQINWRSRIGLRVLEELPVEAGEQLN